VLSEFEDLLSEFQFGQVRHFEADHAVGRGGEPATRRQDGKSRENVQNVRGETSAASCMTKNASCYWPVQAIEVVPSPPRSALAEDNVDRISGRNEIADGSGKNPLQDASQATKEFPVAMRPFAQSQQDHNRPLSDEDRGTTFEFAWEAV
jgi:hypothetical protein